MPTHQFFRFPQLSIFRRPSASPFLLSSSGLPKWRTSKLTPFSVASFVIWQILFDKSASAQTHSSQPVQDSKVVGADVCVRFPTEASDGRNVGLHFGSPDGLPFFKLRIESAVHWRDLLCRNSTGPPTIHMDHTVPRGESTSHHVDELDESAGHVMSLPRYSSKSHWRMDPTLCLQSAICVGNNIDPLCHIPSTFPSTLPSTVSLPGHVFPPVPVSVPVSVSSTGTERT